MIPFRKYIIAWKFFKIIFLLKIFFLKKFKYLKISTFLKNNIICAKAINKPARYCTVERKMPSRFHDKSTRQSRHKVAAVKI